MRGGSEIEAAARALVIPSLDLSTTAGLEQGLAWITRGGRGFLVQAGEVETLAERIELLRGAAPGQQLVFAADLEAGVGSSVRGGSRYPAAMALGAARDPQLAYRVGAAIGSEARSLGLDWVLGPVLDLGDEPANPIVGQRALAAEPELVAELGTAYLRGLSAAGALSCAKHYPGHGATRADSHETLPTIQRSAAELLERDLRPFEEAVAGGVSAVMTAHVAYPDLDRELRGQWPDWPASLHPRILGLLRERLGFAGPIVSDAFSMAGVLHGGDLERSLGMALHAGCDLILAPADPERAAQAIARWAAGSEQAARLAQAAARWRQLRQASASSARLEVEDPGALAQELAERAASRSGPAQPPLAAGSSVGLVVLDDDGPGHLGHELIAGLVEAGVQVSVVTLGAAPASRALAQAQALRANTERQVIVAGCDVRPSKGRVTLANRLFDFLAGQDGQGLTLVVLGSPHGVRGAVPPGTEVIVSFGNDVASQRAAAGVLLGGEAPGRLPVSMV